MLELTLLGLAAQSPRSGYDFKSLFESTALRQFSSSPGSIYPALKRLEAREWLESAVKGSAGDRSRRIYRPTSRGRKALREWLVADPTVEEIERDPRLPILRFSLLGTIDPPPEDVARFLERLESAARRYIEVVEQSKREMERLQEPFPALALEHGSRSLETLADWSREARRAFTAEVS
ncbi:MAG: PadR family transcriptional regulator [Gemmatimonadota bacterium]|nr:PadR family transcriptional regulator [Gemmatimonadota bacterium]